MLRREIVERQQHVTVLAQTLGGLGILGVVFFQEGVEGLCRVLSGGCHPDFMDV